MKGNKIIHYAKKIKQNSRVEKSYLSKIKFANELSEYLRKTIIPFYILLALYSLYYFEWFVTILTEANLLTGTKNTDIITELYILTDNINFF